MKKIKLFSSKDHCWKERETKWPNSALRHPKIEHNAFHLFISKFSYVFWSYNFSLHELFQDFPLNFMFFHFFLKQNKSVCICLHTHVHVLEHTHIQTHTQESKQKPVGPFYVSQLLLRFRLALECGWYTHITHTEEKWFCHSYQVPVANSFLLRAGNLCWASVWFKFVHVLSILSESPWVHTCSSSVKSVNCCFLGVFHPF